MMKWFTKGTSTEVRAVGHQEVVSIRGRRRNDKYARLHTIITFLHYVVPSRPLQIKRLSVLVWEFERDGRAESDEGQRTVGGSSPDIRAIFVCRNSEVVPLPWRQLVFSI